MPHAARPAILPVDFHALKSGPWNLWADRVLLSKGDFSEVAYHHTGEKWWVKMHEPANLVPVRLIEDETGNYYGWMDSEQENAFPGMIWPSEVLFRMCFSAGPEPLIRHLAERGHIGKIVRLRMEERDDDGTDTPRR